LPPAYPFWLPPPERPFIQEVGANPGKLRIAYTTKAISEVPVHGDCVAAVQEAAMLCDNLGHELIEASPVIDDKLMREIRRYWSLAPATVIEYWRNRLGKEPKPEHFEPMTWTMYEWGRKQDVLFLYRALEAIQRISEKVAVFFRNYDLFLTPTLAEPPVPLGTFDPTPEEPLQGFIRAASFSPFTGVFNATGHPAMSVPLFWNQEGLPIGTQFVARYGDEATLFRPAAQLEMARPWSGKRPPVWAG